MGFSPSTKIHVERLFVYSLDLGFGVSGLGMRVRGLGREQWCSTAGAPARSDKNTSLSRACGVYLGVWILRVGEAGSYLRLIDSCITQLKAQGPSKTCNGSKEEEEEGGGWEVRQKGGFGKRCRRHCLVANRATLVA